MLAKTHRGRRLAAFGQRSMKGYGQPLLHFGNDLLRLL